MTAQHRRAEALRRFPALTNTVNPGTEAMADQQEAVEREVSNWCANYLARRSLFPSVDYVYPFLPELRKWADDVMDRYRRDFSSPELGDEGPELLAGLRRRDADSLARYGSLFAGLTIDQCESVTGEPSLTRPWTEAERAPIAVVTARRIHRSFEGGQFTMDVKSDVLQRHVIRGGYTLDRVAARIESGEIPTSCDARLFGSCAAWNERRHTVPIAIGEFAVMLRICGHCISTFHEKYAIGECRTIETYDICPG
jgi:hypothetical protein